MDRSESRAKYQQLKPKYQKALRRFRIGQRVRVLAPGRPVAVIEDYMGNIEGGVLLDRRVVGFRYWNVDSLKRA